MPRSVIRTATTAIAIAALAAPTALARPDSMPPTAAKAAAAAEQHKQARIAATGRYPTRPAQGEQANPRPDTPPPASADDGIAWTTIGLGIAGGLLAMSAIAGFAGSRRTGRARSAA